MKRVLLLLSSAFFVVAGATDIPDKEWECERLDDDHVMIHNANQSRRAAAIDPDTAGDIAVPSTLRSVQVVSIGEKAFYNCSKLTSVTIPEGVTNIAENAFWGCTSLTNIVFPTSLRDVGFCAFSNCCRLVTANFTGSSLIIGNHAFRDCPGIREFSFSGDLISIGDCAFSGCTGLGDVALASKSVKTGKCSFSIYLRSDWYLDSSACTSLTNLSIEASNIEVGETAFAGCTKLSHATLSAETISVGEKAFNIRYRSDGKEMCSPCVALLDLQTSASNLTFGASAFAGCSSLTNAFLAGTVSATIGQSAFSGCLKLAAVELPVALTEVATNAFYQCKALKSIAFPLNVTHVSYRAFDTCESLRTVIFPEGLKEIDAQAFYGCKSVENLSFPQSLASIGAWAFECCDQLGAVRFCEGNTNLVAASTLSIGERAFYKCCSLTNVALSQAVSSLGARAFSQCDALAWINLPSNFTDIAESVFEDCASLPTINLPDTLKSIGNTAFFGCTNLTDFLIPTQNVVSLGAKAFKNTRYWNEYHGDLVVNNGYILGFKNDPVDVTLPDGCTAIPVSMFEGMTNLASVTIPSSVTEIGARAFNGCSSITNLAFTNVTTIGNSAFEGCASLAAVTLSPALTAIPGNCFKDCTSLLSVHIPDAVASIGEYAFYNCASLTNVTGGSGVTMVGDAAFAYCVVLQPFEFPNDVAYGVHVFQGCTWTEHVLFPTVGTLKDEYPATYMNITSVVFSSSMTTITNGACAGCSSLACIRIPDGVTSIGTLAFDGCTSLTSVVMSASVSNVIVGAFASCPSIVSVTVNGLYPMRDLFPQSYANLLQVGFSGGVTSLCSNFMAGCSRVSTVAIPTNVTSIAAYAFQGCGGLSNLEMPSRVTSVGVYAFQGCSGIASLLLPSCLKTIPEGMCSGCTALGAIDFPDGVTSIGSLAFNGCTSLRSVTMSASVTSVESDAFKGCTSLVSLVVSGQFALAAAFPDTYANWTEVGIASDAESLCDELFKGCASLTTVEIPWRVESIGSETFYGCSALKGIVVPEYVTSLGANAFGKCTSLSNVNYLCEMPEDVSTNIYAGAYHVISKVLLQCTSWQTATNAAGATILPSEWCGRPIVWWATGLPTLAKVRFSDNTDWGGGVNQYYVANAGRQILHLPTASEVKHPFNSQLALKGWYTEPWGGEKIEEGQIVTGDVKYYAHWTGGGSEEEEDGGDDDDDGEGDDDDDDGDDSDGYDFRYANKYNGYLLDGESVVGSVQIAFAKGQTSKKTEETSAYGTAKVQLLGESQISLKGSMSEDETAEFTASRTDRTLELSADGPDLLTGSFDGYEVVAYRDLFSSKKSEDTARGNAFWDFSKAKFTAVLEASGETAFTTGYAALSVTANSRRSVKVAGTMPDGTKISASASVSITEGDEGDDVAVAAVVIPMYSKKGGFAFLLKFGVEGSCEISGVSAWIVDKEGTTAGLSAVGIQSVAGLESGDHAFAADVSSLSIEDVEIDSSLSPDGTEFSATASKWTLPKADKVKFLKDEGCYEVTTDYGNPAALKLTYNSKTGLFSGTFKVYGITSGGKSKTYSATVKGGVLDGIGYGTAVIKKVGNVTIAIE